MPEKVATGPRSSHPAGDRMDPVPATVGAEDLGGGVRGVGSAVSAGCGAAWPRLVGVPAAVGFTAEHGSHPAGDRMDPVPATVGAEDLGGGVRGVGSAVSAGRIGDHDAGLVHWAPAETD